ncbi:hypothetical protein [Paenibacillus sp. LjRoot56]|uniref:hypothetical protein n=1 Tax=Paenibacillus sp. LjRoot56 TaxID=3342333 RepID=UPI003ECCE615
MTKAVYNHLIFVLILAPITSIVMVLGSALFLPTTIDTPKELSNAKFGLPISFIKQDLLKSGANGYEGGFPHPFSLQIDFLDHDLELEFIKSDFLLSIAIVWLLFVIAYFVVRKLTRKCSY